MKKIQKIEEINKSLQENQGNANKQVKVMI